MKKHPFSFASLAAGLLILAGCGSQSSVDTSAFESAFKDAAAPVKACVKQTVSYVKAADYSAALAEINKLPFQGSKITTEQQQAMTDLIAAVSKVMHEAASKAAGDANKAAQDLQKSLPK